MNYLTAGGVVMLVFGLGAIIRFLVIKDIAMASGLEPAAGAVLVLFGIGLLVKGQQKKA